MAYSSPLKPSSPARSRPPEAKPITPCELSATYTRLEESDRMRRQRSAYPAWSSEARKSSASSQRCAERHVSPWTLAMGAASASSAGLTRMTTKRSLEVSSAERMDARVGRAVALMAASILGIAMAAVLFLHPNVLPSGVGVTEAQRVPFHASAIDFVSPHTGWVVVDFATGDYALLRTTDGGLSWSRQLSGPAQGSPHYLKFFDAAGGVTALVGARPVLYRTNDGGRTWTSIPALGNHSTALSWSFVDSDHGWLLADPQTGSPP